ncbi:MAG: hypothetical protein ACYSWQ_02950 [Planctomycetota bacterium]|jgi:hypothetical protein
MHRRAIPSTVIADTALFLAGTGWVDDGIVTINGSGFAGYLEGLETSVTGKITAGIGRTKTTTTVEATIVSWSDTVIKADFGASPDAVTVNSVFGTGTYPN